MKEVVKMKRLGKLVRDIYLFVSDILLCIIAHALVIALVFPIAEYGMRAEWFFYSEIVAIIIYVLCLKAFKLYKVYWEYGSIKEYSRLLFACATAFVLSIVVNTVLFKNYSGTPKFNIAVNFLMCCFVCGLRFFIRLIHKFLHYTGNNGGKRVLIIGAGRLASMLLRDIQNNENLEYRIVGLIDDDDYKKGRLVCGAKVLGNRNDIPRICAEKRVKEIIFAIHTISSEQKSEIVDICTETGCSVKVMPGVETMLLGEFDIRKMRDVQIEDLLERNTVKFDTDAIKRDLFDKTVLVTGGGGSIGSELCRQIIRFKPKTLIILDIYENTTYEIENELREKYPEQSIEVLIASVRDKERLESIFETYRPEIIFHAAAHKHVPLMETSPCDAVKNNVFGTLNVAKCADKFGAKRFVMISTDKAVNPTNVMGATKRMCEMIIQTMATESKTEFVAVRFGNVLGSNGSVIPRFKKQIEAGGPVTVTHPEITRFFMTIPEAARLVLQAAEYAKGGEIFVLDMGSPVKIYDLAKKLIRLAGFRPEIDIKIEFTGLRPGEKLYEELLMDEEGLKQTVHSKIFIGHPMDINHAILQDKLDILEDALNKGNDAVKQALKTVVPTYRTENSSEQENVTYAEKSGTTVAL